MKHHTVIVTIIVLLLSACAGTLNTKEKPLRYETTLHGEHVQSGALCSQSGVCRSPDIYAHLSL